jgi:hypothetical protein
MKKVLFILSVLMVGLNCNAKGGATINFQTKTHDFGQISENDQTASYNFTFTNSGDAPLVIHKAVASCGCTTPIFPKEPIAPGAAASIKVTYNTVGRPGTFHKTITVYCNDVDAPNVILVIKGEVVPKEESIEDTYPKNMQGLRLKKNNVSMLEAKIGSTRTETIEMVNTNSKPVKISFSKLPRHIRVTTSNPILKPNETGLLTINYLAGLAKDYGKRQDSFYIVIDPKDKFNSNNKIYVSAFITDDFSRLTPEQRKNAPLTSFSDYRINFGNMTSKTHKTTVISLTNKGNSTLYIHKIVPEYDGIKVTPERKNIPAGKTIKIKIDFNTGTFNGNVVKNITFITNDPKNSSTKIFITAQVINK